MMKQRSGSWLAYHFEYAVVLSCITDTHSIELCKDHGLIVSEPIVETIKKKLLKFLKKTA